MNERIRELKQQAGIDDNPDQEGLDLFAELIIREFAEKCVYVVDRQEILAHFGVEE